MGTIWDILGSVCIWGDGINLDPSPRHSSLRPGSPRTSVMKLEDDEPKPLGPSQGLVIYSHVGPKRKQQLKESDTSALWVFGMLGEYNQQVPMFVVHTVSESLVG